MSNPINAADIPALLSASPRFASVIRDAESLAGDERREAVRKIATGFFRGAVTKYIALGGNLADELAAHLPANDAGKPIAEASPRVASVAPPPEPQPVTKRPPRKWDTPKVNTKPYENVVEGEAGIDQYVKTSGNVRILAAQIGASLDAKTIDETDAAALLQRLHEKSGVEKPKLRNAIKNGRRTISAEYKAWEEEEARNAPRGCGFEFLKGTDYVVSDDGTQIGVNETYGDKKEFVAICRVFQAPFKACDQDSDNWGLMIQFTDDKGKEKETVIRAGELHKDSLALRERLADLGLDPVPGAKLELMFHEIGRRVTETITNFTQAGWHGPLTFAAPNGEVISTDPAMKNARVAKSACWKVRGNAGSFEVEQATLSRLSEIGDGFALANGVALAGPLSQLINEPINRGGNLTGLAETGKTSGQQAMAAFWGSPVLGKGAVQPARGTLNGFESVAKIANGTVLAIDETKSLDDRDFSMLAFMLAQGSGKLRQNVKSELRDSASWKMNFLISSERSSKQITAAAGQELLAGQSRRLVDVVFEKSDAHEGDYDEVKSLMLTLAGNSGHSGPRFVRYLIESGISAAPGEVAEELRKQQAHLIAVADVPKGMQDSATFFALARTGAIYGAKAGVLSPAMRDRCLAAADLFWGRFAASEEAKALDPGKRALERFKFYLITNMGRTGHELGAENATDVRKTAATVYWYDGKRFIVPQTSLAAIIGNVPEAAFVKALRADDCWRPYSKNQGGGRTSKATFWIGHPSDWGDFPALIIDRAKMGFHTPGTLEATDDVLPRQSTSSETGD